eukprot:TRINITY_DN24351_c0_g1_i16.p1 TRINITY_DN24351_c0_g1~~TRINITY_DN24351_c0_g1_i16.p1  ORF type:complete len:255 (+),score=-18.63 TRINITY_DN24351_c0_g1_i16:971-1735(+)
MVQKKREKLLSIQNVKFLLKCASFSALIFFVRFKTQNIASIQHFMSQNVLCKQVFDKILLQSIQFLLTHQLRKCSILEKRFDLHILLHFSRSQNYKIFLKCISASALHFNINSARIQNDKASLYVKKFIFREGTFSLLKTQRSQLRWLFWTCRFQMYLIVLKSFSELNNDRVHPPLRLQRHFFLITQFQGGKVILLSDHYYLVLSFLYLRKMVKLLARRRGRLSLGFLPEKAAQLSANRRCSKWTCFFLSDNNY